MILAMGIFYGGLAQVFAGIMEFRKNNTFGTTAFTSYGLFWMSFALIKLLEQRARRRLQLLAWYLVMWGLFTAYMFIGTLRLNRALQVVFGSLTILFCLLAIGLDGRTSGRPSSRSPAGRASVCGFSAIYAAAAQVLNETYGKQILPLGAVKPAEAVK